MKPDFLAVPQCWTQAQRLSHSPTEYACAVERHQRPVSLFGRLLRVALLLAVMVAAFALLG